VAPVKRLPELIKDRLAELGEHGQPLSIRAAARASKGKVSHGQLASIVNGDYGRISDRVIEGIAIAIDVPKSVVEQSYGIRRPHGPFVLPPEADRLTRRQRDAVLSVVRAMLDPAAEDEPGQPLRAVARQGQRGHAAAVDKRAAAARRRQGK
jgi:hypothetical protein